MMPGLVILMFIYSQVAAPDAIKSESDGEFEIIVDNMASRENVVRTANMKLTIDKKIKIIVNVSDCGCPDVSCLACEMVGKHLDKAPRPATLGIHFVDMPWNWPIRR